MRCSESHPEYMGWSATVRAAKARHCDQPEGHLPPSARVALAAMARADEYAATTLTNAIYPITASTRRKAAGPTAPIRELLVRAVGDRCNLACRYCYETARRGQGAERRMRIETLR